MYNQLYTRIAKAAKLTIPRSKILFLRKQHEPPLPGKKKNVTLILDQGLITIITTVRPSDISRGGE